ncbi:MAG: isoprenylcysteine carboxylmethyltransferase family protein [Succinivibrio sp.]|nr:isoprenylcysteine carboxylmethyltransferase family protein [Succinivibrio sp.]
MQMPLKDVLWYIIACLVLLGGVPLGMAVFNWYYPVTFMPDTFFTPLIAGLTSAIGLLFIYLAIKELWVKGQGCAGSLGKLKLQTETKVLVTSGPYAVCRNPMHFGLILYYLGVCCALNSFLGLLVPFLVLVTAYLLAVFVDERRLRAEFKEEYEAYCAQVPRFWPRNVTKNTLNSK